MVTQDQWFERLKSWTPGWFFEESQYNEAILKATARVLYSAQLEISESLANAFISEAEGQWLDLLGYELKIFRESGELDADYRVRIAFVYNPSIYANLVARVTAVLNNGVPVLYRNYKYGFADDDLFADDTYSVILTGLKKHNWFTLLIPTQVAGDEDAINAAVIAVVNKYKGFGTNYDVVFGVE